ncbi:helix-turn-helix domain-containing protein [Acidiferrimicrobium sp. IK]|uniref:GlxA family transcriptional regulator n=1 Tax=Acidiferrimicrobium sp. IK TaxID=2871700 RepID=UPI0021CB3761|nr:helix-turn-helix domain-containing protein [Acidiferrimicrobium sp. IK]MCU4186246.1 helix-turn-helix domain-containing protein [Acidiferrimicrobium sp. IK]
MRKGRAIASGAPISVAMLIGDGLSPFEFAVACEVFGYDRSHLGVPWYSLAICAADPGPVTTQVGFSVHATGTLADAASAHTVLVPPIVGPAGGSVDRRLIEAIADAHRRGARLASLCTGAFLLAEAGVLDGRRATTHWLHAPEMATRFPAVDVDPKVLYVDTGGVLTSAGSAASIDLCLHMVRADYGAAIANSVARNLVVPPHREGGQAQYVATPLPADHDADSFSEVLAWAEEHLDEDISVQLLARRAAMSARTFARRFSDATGTTPHRWLCRQRVLLAQRLLETTDLPVERIADRCGLGTATNLRVHFRSELGVSPAAYRRTFRHESAA